MCAGWTMGVWLIGAVSVAEAGPCASPLGQIVSIQGTVETEGETAGDWSPARLDQTLCAGAMIRVADRSRAEVALINQPKMRIDQNTTVQFVRAAERGSSLISILRGAAYFFSRQPRVLEIDTPYVTAGIEGTEFLIRVEQDRSLLTVFEGTVAWSNDRGRLMVAAGNSAVAEADTAPAPFLVVRPRDAVQWALYYPPLLLPVAAGAGDAAGRAPAALKKAAESASGGDLAEAFRRLDVVPDADRDATFYVYRAATLLAVGRVDEARTDIDQALTADPGAGLAYALRAVIEVAQDDRTQALEDSRRAVELLPDSAAAQIALSYAEQAWFRIEAARHALKRAVEAQPDDALAWARLSEVELMMGDRRAALEAAKKARDLAPGLARTQTVLGFAALVEFDTAKAKAAFDRAIAIDSANPQPRMGLGLARIRDGDLRAGRSNIEIAVALDPDSSLLRSYLGKAYFEEKRDALATDQFGMAKQLDPADPTPWFYDAILKETENRPVEALRDLQTSIRLNDDRAVYRSRELLDADRAARGASLARIYNDLGFEQLGLNEATHSLTLDPANSSAHRFLSDVYATQPRREIARASELLQAQLFQEINLNPVQPSLAETNLNLITRDGPARPGFNEFNAMFERNQVQVNSASQFGDHETRGEEVTVSGIFNQFSASVGQFWYETDGFRDNNDYEHAIYDAFAQAALTPWLNVQAEGITRRSQEGDLRFNFDPKSFAEDAHRGLDQDIARVGVRLSPSPNSDLIGSVIATRREENVPYIASVNKGFQAEGEYVLRGRSINITSGLAYYDVDQQLSLSFPFEVDNPIPHSSIVQKSAYVYANVRLPENMLWTVGLGYDDHRAENLDIRKFDPKLGLQWDISDRLRLRLAAFRTLKPPIVSNRTIQPTQVAGFNQFYDDSDGTVAWNYGAAIEARLDPNWFAGLAFSGRQFDEPVLNEDRFAREERKESLYRSYLYWTPATEWALSAELQLNSYTGNPRVDLAVPAQVETWSAPFSVRYFNPLGFFAGVTATLVHQDVTREGAVKQEGNSSFATVDTLIGYRLPNRRGVASIEVSNLFDQHFKYQDDNFREFSNEPSVGPYLPERSIIGRLTLNF